MCFVLIQTFDFLVFDQGTMYLYCEVRPREKNNTKLAKLIKFFQHKNLVSCYCDAELENM
jgi:hypothetical protein